MDFPDSSIPISTCAASDCAGCSVRESFWERNPVVGRAWKAGSQLGTLE